MQLDVVVSRAHDVARPIDAGLPNNARFVGRRLLIAPRAAGRAPVEAQRGRGVGVHKTAVLIERVTRGNHDAAPEMHDGRVAQKRARDGVVWCSRALFCVIIRSLFYGLNSCL